MSNCKNCANAIFNEQWGEYKCKVFEKTIYDPSRILGCEAYKNILSYATIADINKKSEETK